MSVMTERKKLQIAVYTCNVGNYDVVLPPHVPANGVQFYCFTDRPQRRIAGWKMMPLAQPPSISRPDLVNRYHKFFPYRVLPKVDCSLYIDSNIRVFGDILPWVEKWAEKHVAIVCMKHPVRSTFFEEAERCEDRGLFDEREKRMLQRQLAAYRADGMPVTQQLSQNGVLLCFHDVPGLDEAMEMWWHQILIYTRRDQISLPYVIWKTGLPTALIGDINVYAYVRKAGLPSALINSKNRCTSNSYFVIYAHRKHGIKGLWQLVHLMRYDVWWCGVLCRMEYKLQLFTQPVKKVLRSFLGAIR